MTYTVPLKNWVTSLMNAVEDAHDGDVIIIHGQEMMELAERAKKRMCPDKGITFEVGEHS